jgi:hypothetical protein
VAEPFLGLVVKEINAALHFVFDDDVLLFPTIAKGFGPKPIYPINSLQSQIGLPTSIADQTHILSSSRFPTYPLEHPMTRTMGEWSLFDLLHWDRPLQSSLSSLPSAKEGIWSTGRDRGAWPAETGILNRCLH